AVGERLSIGWSELRAVGLVPLWPLPARALEEHRPQRLLAVVKGSQAEFARPFHRLRRVDDVVHLAIVLGSTGAQVRAGERMRVEAVEIFFAEVEVRETFHHPLGHGARRPHAVRDPDGLTSPEA